MLKKRIASWIRRHAEGLKEVAAYGGMILAFVAAFALVLRHDSSKQRIADSVAAVRSARFLPHPLVATDTLEARIGRRMADVYSAGRGRDSLSIWFIDHSADAVEAYGRGSILLSRAIATLDTAALDALLALATAYDVLNVVPRTRAVATAAESVATVLGTTREVNYQSQAIFRHWAEQTAVPAYYGRLEEEADSAAASVLARLGYKKPAITLCATFKRLRARDSVVRTEEWLAERTQRLRSAFPSAEMARTCR